MAHQVVGAPLVSKMFYSHQLLARKAPLGQIWMAATLHAKINRKRLDKLDIIKICEEILNPSVPMALRLSGILMGGMVIVYERKVKLLYDDVSRLLIEINEAWKIRLAVDHTVLPKGKAQAMSALSVSMPFYKFLNVLVS
ncbi:sister chromatid cohesion 1 protein 1 isoform X1 [Triticum aestivum]|uniref:sister chromatid cohesion 1 protein 1 isoform X1 n=1 Tax=Triticum aestivum TaxID=4565 RepID=UPI001D0088DA|nr:sister chromatid cohesion 1 protein 1-like isoform X1 [Triticum aestivum]